MIALATHIETTCLETVNKPLPEIRARIPSRSIREFLPENMILLQAVPGVLNIRRRAIYSPRNNSGLENSKSVNSPKIWHRDHKSLLQ